MLEHGGPQPITHPEAAAWSNLSVDSERNDEDLEGELDENLLDEDHADALDEDLGPALGEDPFSGVELSWVTRDQGEASIEVLGHDPLENMDMEWLAEMERDLLTPGQERALLAADIPPLTPPEELDASQEAARTIERAVAAASPTVPTPVAEAGAPTPAVAPPSGTTSAVAPGVPDQVAPPEQPVAIVTPKATFSFPADFKWGVATSAHQVEGESPASDWRAWEEEEGHIRNNHRVGAACDWWQNAEADFDRAVSMGVRALRLSVDWARIEPRPGAFSNEALKRYVRILQALLRREIEPMVTLHHFTNPLWLAEQGGWASESTPAQYAAFVRRTVEALGRYCDLWCTINEPNVYTYMGYVVGQYPPGVRDLQLAARVGRHMLEGHAAAYREIHDVQPHARVGLALDMRVFVPVNPESKDDQRVAAFADQAYNQAFLDPLVKGRWTGPLGGGFASRIRRTLDWIGLNYYARQAVAVDRTRQAPGSVRMVLRDSAELLEGDSGEFYPQGMFECLQRLEPVGVPVYVTENGVPDQDDVLRGRYILTHVHQMWRALNLGCPVEGYYHWTLVDNFEWNEGWTLRYGLYELDPRTQVRTARRSAELYSSLAHANAITPDMIDAYAPEARPQILPGEAIAS